MDSLMEKLINILLIFLSIFIFSKIKYIFQPILDVLGTMIGALILSLFFYYILRPIVRYFKKKFNSKYQGLISALVVLLTIIIIILIISRAGIILVDQFKDTFIDEKNDISEYKDMVEKSLSNFNIDKKLISKLSNKFNNMVSNIGEKAYGLFTEIGDKVTQLLLIPFIVFYLLKDDGDNIDKIIHLVPNKNKENVLKLLLEIDGTLSTYIVGQLIVALIIGTLMFIGYIIIGVPNAFLMGVFSTITAIIPIIGAFLGILPAILISITIDFRLVIKIIILSIIVQQLEGNLITPNLMGSKLSVHPLSIMIVIIISIKLMGIFGAFIGIPVYLIIDILIKKYYFKI